jgi:signal transduction histidine kinase
LIGYMDVSRDISERRRMETEIETAMTHLTESARLAAIGELASGVAHRIYNPLTSIIANAQILKHNNSDQLIMFESVEDIEKAGWKAQEVVRQLLDFSRPSNYSLGVLSVEDTVRKALELVGSQIEANGVNLALNFRKNSPSIFGNARQMEDLWVNLLLLARDATSDGKLHFISVKTDLVGREVVVEVFDDGNPIPEEQLAHVFEPDFIGGSIGRGTGLELSICREIVRQQKGRISVKSNSEGTTFFVHFPVKVTEPRA